MRNIYNLMPELLYSFQNVDGIRSMLEMKVSEPTTSYKAKLDLTSFF